MKIKRVRIQNFRSIRDLEVDLGSATVFVGPNNAGKTAILEAIRIALTRRWGQRGTGFTEYDIHLEAETSDPKTSGPIVIELDFQEEQPLDWPEDLVGDLGDVIQPDPVTGRSSILLRVSCRWEAEEGSYVPRWEFVNVARQPLTGRAARAVNLQEFFQYLPVFYLNALRDADDEFSSRSQFWGRLLRSVNVPESSERRAQRVLDLLNRKLLDADARLGTLANTLSTISDIAMGQNPGRADLRMVPLKAWDLISRAEVIYRCDATKPWLPLERHGQGVQSLSVVFLFRAFVEQLLVELYKPDSEPVLELEEPETHLHPQACRTLWEHISTLPGQKLVTTHSPYFVQKVPFRELRLVRLGATGTTVSSLPSHFVTVVHYTPGIDHVVNNSNGLVVYDPGLGELRVNGALDQNRFRDLLTAYSTHAERPAIHSRLRDLYDQSQMFVTDEELNQLETFARRIRGEIFFAKKWLLVEGQSEYSILHGLAFGLNYPLDAHGIAVIDFQNNGNPACFAALARAFGIPWCAIFDGDQQGQSFWQAIKNRGFQDAELNVRCKALTSPNLEAQLVADGLQAELKEILLSLGDPQAVNFTDPDLITALEASKSAYSADLAQRCATTPSLAAQMPLALRQTIAALHNLA